MAELVNVIAPIMTRAGGGAWAQTIYYPLMQASLCGRGTSLKPIVRCEKSDTSHYSDVPVIDAAAVENEDGGVTLFAVNRCAEEDVLMSLDLRSFGDLRLASHCVMHHDDMKAVNTEDRPNEVVPAETKAELIDGCVKLPKASWNVIRFTK